MIAYVKEHDGVTSSELAQLFLKFKNPDETLAHVAIRAILANDKRCVFGDDKVWRTPPDVAGSPVFGQALSERRYVAVYLLSLPGVRNAMPFHLSVWTVDETPELLYDEWLEDPDQLPHDEQEMLRSVRDRPYGPDNREQLYSMFTTAIPVFLSSRHMVYFSESVAPSGISSLDDGLVLPVLLRCAGVSAPRPLSIDSCYEALFRNAPTLTYAYKYGECFARIVQDLFDRLSASGVVHVEDLYASDRDDIASFDFSNKGFGLADIVNAPSLPGVYGFKTKEDRYLYIGKAVNLRRRLSGYFRRTDESPEKIDRIRSEANGLVTSVCGSELESLIYEYRLIRKHSPALNTQRAINERTGNFQPLDDCVIMLPHAEADKGMAFLFRKNQKIVLRPFFSDFRDAPALTVDLAGFFFGASLKPGPEDFPEAEIATRWVKERQDELAVVSINRVATAKEACDTMRSLWKDLCENREQVSESGRGE